MPQGGPQGDGDLVLGLPAAVVGPEADLRAGDAVAGGEFLALEAARVPALVVQRPGVGVEAAADEVERVRRVHQGVALGDEPARLDCHVQPVLDRRTGRDRHGVGSGEPVVPDAQPLALGHRVGVDAVDEVHERVLGCGVRAVSLPRVLQDVRVLGEVGAEHVLVGAHVPVPPGEDLGVLVHQARVVGEGLGPRDVQPGRLLVAVRVGELEVGAVLDPRVHVTWGVDLGNDLDVVLLAESDQPSDLVLGVVTPGVGLEVGVALHLQFEEQLVELVVRHLAHQVLQPGQRDMDVAGADADAPFLVARHVDGASGGDPVALGEALEEGPGAVEGAGLGRAGHRQPSARVEFVSLRTERGSAGLDVDNDVTGPGSAAHDGDRAMTGRPEVGGEGAGDPALGSGAGHQPGVPAVGVTPGFRGPVGECGHGDRCPRLLARDRGCPRCRRDEQRQCRQDSGPPVPTSSALRHTTPHSSDV